jgi:hypothetical protein
MAQEQVKVFSGNGMYIENEVNRFLGQHQDDIDVIGFQVVDNRSPNVTSTDGKAVFYLLCKFGTYNKKVSTATTGLQND